MRGERGGGEGGGGEFREGEEFTDLFSYNVSKSSFIIIQFG